MEARGTLNRTTRAAPIASGTTLLMRATTTGLVAPGVLTKDTPQVCHRHLVTVPCYLSARLTLAARRLTVDSSHSRCGNTPEKALGERAPSAVVSPCGTPASLTQNDQDTPRLVSSPRLLRSWQLLRNQQLRIRAAEISHGLLHGASAAKSLKSRRGGTRAEATLPTRPSSTQKNTGFIVQAGC